MRDDRVPPGFPILAVGVGAPVLAAVVAAGYGWERGAYFFIGAPMGVLAVSVALVLWRRFTS